MLKINKTKYLFVLILFIIAAKVNAQIFDAGIYGGFTSSQIDGDDAAGYNKPGFMSGIFVKTELNKSFDFKMGLQYISKGARDDKEDPVSYFKIHFDYIELPLSVVWKATIKFSLEGGIAPAYLFNIKQMRDGYSIDDDGNFSEFDPNGFIALHYKLGRRYDLSFRFSYSAFSSRPIRRFYHNNSIGCFLTYNFKEQ